MATTEEGRRFVDWLVSYAKEGPTEPKERRESKNSSGSDDENKDARERDKTRERNGDERSKLSLKKKKKYDIEEEGPTRAEAAFDPSVMTGQAYADLVDKVVELESAYLQIDPPIWDNYYNVPSDAGYYSRGENALHINLERIKNKRFSDYADLLDTIIHELRHCFQYTAIEESAGQPEVPEEIRRYLAFSDLHYDEDMKRGQDRENGMEADSWSYACGRTRLYLDYTAAEILQMNEAPRHVVHNQIILGPGDISPSGRRAPVTVGKTFDSREFRDYARGGSGRSDLGNKQNTYKTGGDNMSRGIDFSDEAIARAAKAYGAVLDNIQAFSEKLIRGFEELIKEHPYKQLQNAANVFVGYHGNELPREITAEISKWASSDNSFTRVLDELSENASASRSKAQYLEKQLEDQVYQRFKPISEVQIDKAINVTDAIIQQDGVYISHYYRALEGLKEESWNQFLKAGEGNLLYSTMEEIVMHTFGRVQELYATLNKDIGTISDEYVAGHDKASARGMSSGMAAKNRAPQTIEEILKRRKGI